MNVPPHLIFYLYVTEEPQLCVSTIIYDCWWRVQTESVPPPEHPTNVVYRADSQSHQLSTDDVHLEKSTDQCNAGTVQISRWIHKGIKHYIW